MEKVKMSLKEAERLSAMEMLREKILTQKRVSEVLGLSIRQAKRLWKRYKNEGALGLVSKRRGQPGPNKTPLEKKIAILELVKEHYADFGPTLAAEKLYERDNIKISNETLRKWMIELGLRKAKHKSEQKVHQRRERRERFGELLQGDGSPHDWFEGRGPKCCLVQFVDDATSRITAAKFFPSETTEAYLTCLEEQLRGYGRPLGIYVDRHSIFRVNREGIEKGVAITHFGKVLKRLDIELICANSPQAKGRVERKNGVLQDRLIKEMRLAGISSIEEANAFLPKFIEEHNKRFGYPPKNPENAHRPLKPQDDMKQVFARQEQRVLSKNLTFQFEGTLYQIKTETPNRLKHARVDVLSWPDRPIEVEFNQKKLSYTTWEEKQYEQPKIMDAKQLEMLWPMKKLNRPSRHHPWKRCA